jgi:hypothetical protein
MMRAAFRKFIARAAVFAVLFSALSPALAAWRFQDRPDVLAELCTPTGIKRVVVDDGGQPSEQKMSGLLCVLCVAGAQHADTAPTAALGVPQSFTFESPRFFTAACHSSACAAAYYSRGPPSFLI